MRNSKFLPALTFLLLASFIVGGCGAGATAQPVDASTPQPTSSEPPPSTQASTATEPATPTEAATPTETPTEEPALAAISFAADVLPILESRCVNCHGGRETEEGLVLRTYDEVMAGSDNGPVIVPGDIAGSYLVELITKLEMPKRGPKLTPVQIQIITDWVAAGAQNN